MGGEAVAAGPYPTGIMTNSTSPGPRSWAIPWALAVAAGLAFWPTVHHGFVCWDDEHNFSWNLNFGALNWARVGWAWATFRTGVYQPFAWIFLEAQASLWGLDARGYHATSVLLHGLDTALLWRLIIVLLDRCSVGDRRSRSLASGLAALLFAVNPLRVEVVAWASCQPYLPSIFFAMLAILAYLRAHPPAGPPSRAWAVGSWLLFAVSLLFKVETATLPALLVILDVYPLRRIGPGGWIKGSVWREKIPFFGIALVFLAVAAQARGVMDPGAPSRPFDLAGRVGQASYSAVFYLAKSAWPVDLSTFYGLPERIALSSWPFGPATVLVIGLSFGAFLARRRCPALAASWLAYLAILSPHLGFVQTGPVIAADRYGYAATVPLAVLLAGALVRLLSAGWLVRGVVVAGALGLGVVLGGMSWEQCRQWSSSEILLRTALERGGSRSPEVRSALALALLRSRRLPEAAALCEEALRMAPDYFQAHYNFGLILGEQGRYAEAERHFAEAERIEPDDRDAQFNLAVALARQGKTPAAIVHFQRALKLLPLADDAFALAILLNEAGRYPEAADAYQIAARLRPDHAPTHNNLGVVLIALGDLAGAKAQFEEALRLQPGYPNANKGLDLVRQRLGRGP